MRIWNEYGTEHSANLVMIGRFRTVSDASEAESAIDEISRYLSDSGEHYEGGNSYSDGMLSLLGKLRVHTLHPSELDQFVYDVRVKVQDSEITVTTDESDISAFLKILLEFNAKVEVYSAHVYPENDRAE